MGKKFYEEVKNYKIFVIYHEKTRKFFVHFTTAANMKTLFSHHYNSQNYHTQALFAEYKETIHAPQMYIIEEIECPAFEAYRRVVIWIRYFLDHNCIALNDQGHIDNAMDLDEENEIRYLEIKAIPFEKVISEANHECLNHGRQRMERTEAEKKNAKKQVKFFCSQEEYEIIQKQAKKAGKTVSAYLREVAMQGKIITWDYWAIREHTDLIRKTRQELSLVLQLIIETKQATIKDIEYLVGVYEEIGESEKMLLQIMQKNRDKLRKDIIKELKK